LGLRHALNPLPSSWHKKLTPVWLSVKLKLALVWFVGLAGVEVMVGVGGGVVSIVHAKLAAANDKSECMMRNRIIKLFPALVLLALVLAQRADQPRYFERSWPSNAWRRKTKPNPIAERDEKQREVRKARDQHSDKIAGNTEPLAV